MLKVFLVEWWDDACQQHRQEYYRNLHSACDRMVLLADVKKDANPTISTICVELVHIH